MYTQVEKTKDNKSRAVANSVLQKKRGKQSVGFVDNRPKVIEQSKIQKKSNDFFVSKAIQKKVLQLMSDEEKQRIESWITGEGKDYLTMTTPDKITNAELSNAVRLYWFDVDIEGTNYNIGLNIHYNNGGVGGVWAKNNTTKEAHELHPKKPPQHGYDGNVEFELVMHIKDSKLKDLIHPRVQLFSI